MFFSDSPVILPHQIRKKNLTSFFHESHFVKKMIDCCGEITDKRYHAPIFFLEGKRDNPKIH